MPRIIGSTFHVAIDISRLPTCDPMCVNAVDSARKNVTLWQKYLLRMRMKRLTLVSLMLGMLWAGAAHAADAGLCKSLCSADKRECRAHARELAAEDGEMVFDRGERNPMARAAQEQVPVQATRAMDNAGTQTRRIDYAGKCDAAYLRCTRACAAPAESVLVKPKQDR
jgi:hypothetical protein